MENPATTRSAVNGTSNDKKEQTNIVISKTLSKIPHKIGLIKLEGFSVRPEKPSDTSRANSCARCSLRYWSLRKNSTNLLTARAIQASRLPSFSSERYPIYKTDA